MLGAFVLSLVVGVAVYETWARDALGYARCACCGAAWTCASCCAWGATLTLSYQRGAGSLAPVYALAPLSALGYTAPAALMARLVRDVSADAQGRWGACGSPPPPGG